MPSVPRTLVNPQTRSLAAEIAVDGKEDFDRDVVREGTHDGAWPSVASAVIYGSVASAIGIIPTGGLDTNDERPYWPDRTEVRLQIQFSPCSRELVSMPLSGPRQVTVDGEKVLIELRLL